MVYLKYTLLITGFIVLVSITHCTTKSSDLTDATNSKVIAMTSADEVKIAGAMKNVMMKGELFGVIKLDTLDKENLYGLGPLEYLSGEVTIIDGTAYVSTVENQAIVVKKDFNIKAPFFVYSNIGNWLTDQLPDSIKSIKDLENYLLATVSNDKPFTFKLTGRVKSAKIHVVNLPDGKSVGSSTDAHEGQVNEIIQNTSSTIVGYFSTKHKAVFTHHDTFVHMHLINSDHTIMGHLDEVEFEPGQMSLYVPRD